MARLKLGTYSFIIDTDKLQLEFNVEKNFTREELPDNLKPLFDIIIKNEICEKSIFINVVGLISCSGYLLQRTSGLFDFITTDGSLIYFSYSNDNEIAICVNEY